MARGAVALFDQPEGRKLLAKYCRSVGLPLADLEDLVEAVIDKEAMQRRHGLWGIFDERLDAPVETTGNGDVLGTD